MKTVGAGFEIPQTSGERGGGVRSDIYADLGPFKRTNLFGCILGVAKCVRRENDLEMALAWCEEIYCLYRSGYYSSPHPLYDWKDYIMGIPELSFLYASGLCLASDIFASLGNSGTAATRRWRATTTTVNLPRLIRLLR
ncbi:hypothetical protein B0H17DRAFT_224027 [Mycena rosella]|uniref:Uncharacterized protein n=1 Tax=Mycena rosella TaxID=1033263 RepID=A0AAD7CYD3_MYCRO|nr:hypothetical protein B0H17DRAFT_224027 [Mycena rosella]